MLRNLHKPVIWHETGFSGKCRRQYREVGMQSLPVIAVKFYKNEMIQGEAQHDIYKPVDL